ncbi:MAG: hypothetical protein MRY83_23675, partial [Flavobacteriales bacterium]|nr:hypothetical protein [Flavobacteriales bacterium]
DTIQIFSITLKTAQKIHNDSKNIRSNVSAGNSKRNTLVDVTGSLFHAVIKPSLKHGVKYRIPFLGSLIMGVIGRVFNRVLKKNSAEINESELLGTQNQEGAQDAKNVGLERISNAVDNTFMVVMTPILLVFIPILVVFVLLIFLYVEIAI